jgi:homocysteine S-methyltransferase
MRAMGTMLYAKGVFINKCYDELNLRNPEIVAEVHKQYVRAGAEIIETNTYGANRIKLRSFGIEDELRAINERGAAPAREAAGDSVFVKRVPRSRGESARAGRFQISP